MPALVDEDCVSRYHEIVDSLSQAAGLDLAEFRIEVGKVACRLVQGHAADYTSLRVRHQYTNKRYCDSDYFWTRLHMLSAFLDSLDRSAVSHLSAPST